MHLRLNQWCVYFNLKNYLEINRDSFLQNRSYATCTFEDYFYLKLLSFKCF